MDHLKKIFAILSITSRKSLFKLITFSILASLLELGGIGLFYPYLNIILNPNKLYENKILISFYNFFKFNSDSDFLFFLGLISILIVVTSSIIGAYSRILIDRYIWTINTILIKISFKKYLKQSYVEIKKMNSNNITNNIISEVSVFVNGLMVPIFDSIPRIFILLLSIVLLIFINLKVSIVIFLFISIIYFIIFRIFRKRLTLMSNKRFEMQQALFDYVNSAIRAVKDIKVNNSYEFFINRVEKPAKQYSQLNQTISIFSLMPRYILEALIFSTAMLILMLNQDSSKISEIIPLLSLYAIASFRLIPHIQGLFTAFSKIKFNIKSLEIVYSNITLTKNDSFELNNQIDFNSVRISKLNFKYPDSNNMLLSNINLEINKNQFATIIGKSGSGKSTLIEILLGLITPNEGQIYYNEKLHRNDVTLSTVYKLGYVSQDVILFEGTLKENIFLYNSNLENNDFINNTIKAACLEDVLSSLGGSIEGLISEGGKNLSVGQRQRISIARAIHNKPEVLFLDEATSALDKNTELKIIENIKKLGITVVLITHNNNLISQSDLCYELSNTQLKKIIS